MDDSDSYQLLTNHTPSIRKTFGDLGSFGTSPWNILIPLNSKDHQGKNSAHRNGILFDWSRHVSKLQAANHAAPLKMDITIPT